EVAEIFETQKALGTPYYTCAWLPDSDYATADSIKKTAERVEQSRELLAKGGVTLCMHNHDHEFRRLDGKTKFEILAHFCPKFQFELDVYWSANFAAEAPAKLVS